MVEVLFEAMLPNVINRSLEHVIVLKETVKWFDGTTTVSLLFQGNPFSGPSREIFKAYEALMGSYKGRRPSTDPKCACYEYEYRS